MTGIFDENSNFIIDTLRKRYEVELSDDPDYLFYSVGSTDFLNYKCIRIFYTPENVVPDFNLCDYAIGFHYINFGDRYLRYPVYLVDSFVAYSNDDYANDLLRAQNKHLITDKEIASKDSFCAFVYSNAQAVDCRNRLFYALSNYKKVNSGGKCMNNIGRRVDNKLEFQMKHKFVIAFENTSTSGYTTEKIVHAFSANAVPIYWGNPDIELEFNTKAFINCHKFGLKEGCSDEIIDSIVQEVIRIDQEDAEYVSMIRTPAFIEENAVELNRKKFECFIFNIFEQDLNSAYRRNRYYWGERYERKQRIGNAFYQFLYNFMPLVQKVRKLFRK